MSKEKKTLRRVDAPIYNYWQALYLSFYSSRLYVDVAKRWRGYGLRYLLLVIAIVCIPLSVHVIYNFNQYFNEQMLEPLEKLPVLYIQNGQVVFDKPMPYLIKNRAGSVVAVINSNGDIQETNRRYPDLTILITKEKLYYKPPKFPLFFGKKEELKGETVYAQPINKNSNEVFVAKEWIVSSGILKLKLVAELLVYPLMTGFIYGVYLGVMFFLAFIAQLFAIVIFKIRLTFKDTCRLFLVASTPQTFVFFILLAANITVSLGGLFYIILLAIYFNYAVIAVKRESNEVVHK